MHGGQPLAPLNTAKAGVRTVNLDNAERKLSSQGKR